MPTRELIVSEIQRTAAANGDRPLGRNRFLAETGIREADWLGRYWARWSDAVAEAGFTSNTMMSRYEDEELLRALALESRRLGHLPTVAELRLARRGNAAVPNSKAFERFGAKRDLALRLRRFCDETDGFADVVAVLPVDDDSSVSEASGPAATPTEAGFVYLLRSGRFYKIGLTTDVDQRVRQLRIQLPEPVTEVHRIATDDPRGIERYWHQRFEGRRKNGEWFELNRDDIVAFRRRKFM